MSEMPSHAPYVIPEGEIGEPIEIRVYESTAEGEDEILVAECEFREDTFGGKTSIAGSDLQRTLAVDELVQSLAMLVWNDLLGTPVFREEDAQWVERVEARAAWESSKRTPTQGWIANHQPEPPPAHVDDDLHATLGDADVGSLALTGAEIESVARGEIPSSLLERVMEARSTENLLGSVANVLERVDESSDPFAIGEVLRARREIAEVRRRFDRG